jgi:hypothetical integral membrane protein (TIGR02206 family)
VEYFFSTASDPEHPFILFGMLHVALIVWVAFCGWLIIRQGMKGDDKIRRQLRTLLIFLFLLWEVEWQGWFLVTDTWTAQRALPLHLCSIMIWVSIYGLVTRQRFAMALMYFFGIAGAIQAIITPDAIYAFPHFRFMNTWFSHSLLVIAGLWVVFVEGYRPVLSDVWKCFLTIHIYAIPVYFVNMSLGSNYLYVGAKPETASIMDFFPEWPWYFFILQSLLLFIMLGMYLPFRRQGEVASTVIPTWD